MSLFIQLFQRPTMWKKVPHLWRYGGNKIPRARWKEELSPGDVPAGETQ
jgi:hypothetical protein